jgi:hypothetical protein
VSLCHSTNKLSSFKIGQVSHFPILSHGLSLNTITNALTRPLHSVNKRKNIQCCQLDFFQCSQHKQILFLDFSVFPLFCPPLTVYVAPQKIWTREWSRVRLYNEDIHNAYYGPNIFKW